MTTKIIKSRIIDYEPPYSCYMVKWTVEPFDLDRICFLSFDLIGSEATTPYSGSTLFV